MKIKNPKLSVTVNEGAYTAGWYLDSSNYVHYGQKTESTEFIAIQGYGMFVGAFYDLGNIEVSDMVNCTADSENGYILITDPTEDASCTVSFDDIIQPLG